MRAARPLACVFSQSLVGLSRMGHLTVSPCLPWRGTAGPSLEVPARRGSWSLTAACPVACGAYTVSRCWRGMAGPSGGCLRAVRPVTSLRAVPPVTSLRAVRPVTSLRAVFPVACVFGVTLTAVTIIQGPGSRGCGPRGPHESSRASDDSRYVVRPYRKRLHKDRTERACTTTVRPYYGVSSQQRGGMRLQECLPCRRAVCDAADSSLERRRARRRDCSSPRAFQPSSLSGFELPRFLKGCRNGPSLRPDAGEAHAPLSTTPSSTDQLPSALPLPSESASGSG